MAARTTDEWYEHIATFIPGWQLSEDVHFNRAAIRSMAGLFARLEQDADDHFDQTFIMKATGAILALHGAEVGKDPIPGETQAAYRLRIQRVRNSSDKASILAAVNALLPVGPAVIVEAQKDAPYCSRGVFCSRGTRLMSFPRNFFLIIVPSQGHTPWSSLNRDAYANRGSYVGTLVPISQAYTNIIAAVNEMKAFGVLYGIVEKSA